MSIGVGDVTTNRKLLLYDDICTTAGADCCYGGVNACLNVGPKVTIGKGSCIGPVACYRVAWYAPDHDHSIGINSCVGDFACAGAWQNKATGNMGQGSCNGSHTCYVAGYHEDSHFDVGNESCNGSYACSPLDENRGIVTAIRIGSNSCNCDSCCRCLEDGDVVPGNRCNVLGECCEANGNKVLGVISSHSATSSSTSSPTTSGPTTSTPTTFSPNTLTPTTSSSTTSNPTITPADKFEWYIALMSNATINKASNGLEVNFNISNRVFSLDVFHDDCETPVTNTLNTTYDIVGLGGGFKMLDVLVAINQTEIESKGSAVWTPSTTGGDIKFCMVVNLWDGAIGSTLVNFLETLYTVNVDRTSGFKLESIDSSRTEAKSGGNNDITNDEEIDAYLCNDNFDRIDSPEAMSQGDIMQVCLKVLQQDTSEFEVGHIMTFDITQGANNPVQVVTGFTAGQPDFTYPNLTDIRKQDKTLKVQFQLLAAFFVVPQNLKVTGTLKLELKNSRRIQEDSATNVYRASGGKEQETRMLVEENENEGAVFALDVVLSGVGTSSAMNMITHSAPSAMVAITGCVYTLW